MIAIEKNIIHNDDLSKLKYEYVFLDKADINSADVIISKEKTYENYTILVVENLNDDILNADDFILYPINIEELNYKIELGLKRIKKINEINKILLIDYLTGVYNRRAITDLLKKEIERAKRENLSFALSMIDFDNFKMVNDKYGHDSGDAVLKETAKLLSSNIRYYDNIGRLGGEEFLVIISHATKNEAIVVAERLRKRVENNIIKINGNEIKITISQGISIFTENKNLDQMIKEADIALYKAKTSGKNKVVIYK
ncbi:GGDEF domain-containing protein [Marinitoga litoralis]|uniref:GGDEF domain-containing protein n=1 Tax=Marinitoga litoralis TaxID=570855 RepID=UPI00195FC94C|nr:GGDEF domain-containing protein [Marinitoga litoralis]MBM7559144.1 diguanylate cyclase (GGDEF)-like protein [Marinitoga litoralis]